MLKLFRIIREEMSSTIIKWDSLSPQEKAQACEAATVFAKFAEDIMAMAKEDAKRGSRIVDLENQLQFGLQARPGRLVIDPNKAWSVLEKLGIGISEFLSATSVNAGKVEEMLKLRGMRADDVKASVEECGTRSREVTAFGKKAIHYVVR